MFFGPTPVTHSTEMFRPQPLGAASSLPCLPPVARRKVLMTVSHQEL
jgi:hypothetical protein